MRCPSQGQYGDAEIEKLEEKQTRDKAFVSRSNMLGYGHSVAVCLRCHPGSRGLLQLVDRSLHTSRIANRNFARISDF